VGKIEKLEAFIVFVCDCYDWLKCFNTKETALKMEFKNNLFHKPVFHGLIHSQYENITISMKSDWFIGVFDSVQIVCIR